MIRTCLLFLSTHLLLAAYVSAVDFGLKRDGKLDQTALKRAYKEADWDQVTETLENYLRQKGDSRVDLEERLFAYKYLGVIYAADSTRQPKAESYFTRLLNLASDVEIIDLYASRRVNDIFRQVKREHQERQAYEQRLTGITNVSNASLSTPSVKTVNLVRQDSSLPNQIPTRVKEKKQAWVWWTVGAVTVASAGVGLYYFSQSENDKVTQVTRVEPGKP
jgi:hypothetical protein